MTTTPKTKSISVKEANAFMASENWDSATCARCKSSLERGGGYHKEADNTVDIICRECIYKHDAAKLKQDGILCGSSLATSALLRRDFEVYRKSRPPLTVWRMYGRPLHGSHRG